MADGVSQPPAAFQPSAEIVEAQREIVETFSLFDDWTDRYQHIIDFGRQAPPFPEDWKTEANRLHGCQSQVWIVTEQRGDRLHFAATSDSAIVAGLISILLAVYSDRRPADILATPPDFIKEIQLAEHLSHPQQRPARDGAADPSAGGGGNGRGGRRHLELTRPGCSRRPRTACFDARVSVAELSPDPVERQVVVLEEIDQLGVEMAVRVDAIIADSQNMDGLGVVERGLVGAGRA